MESPKIIALSGKMGTGKTAVAEWLAAALPAARRLSFGDLVKWEVSQMFCFPLHWCYRAKEALIQPTPETRSKGLTETMTVREIMQWYGTEVVRAVDPNYWIDGMRHTTNCLRANYIIIDDVRFPNEAEFVHDQGGLLVRLYPYTGYREPADGTLHESETALDEFTQWDIVYRPAFGEAEAVAASILAYIRKRTTKEGTNPEKYAYGGAAWLPCTA